MKPRRDITLGEMQDECRFRGDNCETVGGDRCKFFEVCATMQTIDKGCLTPIMWNLTDRLESQERELSEKTEQLKDMTARAESAERERDAAIADIERMRKEKIPLCPICDFNDMIRCCHDSHCDGYQLFRWRGAGKETE